MNSADGDRQFSWLHFSGWEVDGRERQPLRGLLEDLAQMREATGPWDAVFITGDLVSTGQASEFAALTERLEELWSHLEKLGSRSVLLTVPGNHDGVRSGSSNARLLRLLADDEDLKRQFWRGTSKFRHIVEDSFENYVQWTRQHPLPRAPDPTDGLLPGEYSVTVETAGGYRVGVVGLNSAFQQLSAGDFHGDLVLHPRQLRRALAGEEPSAWIGRHDATLLLTHHPPSWLSEGSAELFRTEIAPAGRFTAHLCGSLHEARPVFHTSPGRMEILQVPSFRRRGGYQIGSLRRSAERKSLTMWPRRFQPDVKAMVPEPAWGTDLPEDFHLVSFPFEDVPADEAAPTFVVERLEIEDFRCFDRLTLSFDRPSMLEGHWTCIAGINGSGKSSILQALSVVILGPRRASELGGERLNRMRRLVGNRRKDARIRARIYDVEERVSLQLALELGEQGVRPLEGRQKYPAEMEKFWERIDSKVFLGYGATRNISSFLETRYSHLSAAARRHMSLFDPLTQITSAEALLEEHYGRSPLVKLLQAVIQRVFGESLSIRVKGGKVRFKVEEQPVDAVDLPDGFRSSVAWLTDLCQAAQEAASSNGMPKAPEDIRAVVLLDEIGLHLHPSLQRSLVPLLRRALPRVQFIVTTHSPLVLANFDRAELIALDRAEPGGVRDLDRQILGFSTDQIYRWLLETPTTGMAIEQQLEESGSDRQAAEMLEMSPTISASEAKERVEDLLSRLAKIDKHRTSTDKRAERSK